MPRIRLLLFDALHTLIVPRRPIYVQYAQVFEPYLGKLEPARVQDAFKTALKDTQREKPVYAGGAEGWWGNVISRTAIGAGASPQAVEASIATIVPILMKRFSGREGYKLFDDVIPTLETLKTAGMRTGLVSNADLRIKSVMADLGLSELLEPVLVSEEEGIEKPGKEIWERACARAGVGLSETLHVGDELECDYFGATRAGLHALFLRRPESGGDDEGRKNPSQDLTGVQTIQDLSEVVAWLSQKNKKSRIR